MQGFFRAAGVGAAMLGRLPWFALAGLLMTAALASAHPVRVEQTAPTCGVLANLYACTTVWAEVDGESLVDCLVLAQPTTACLGANCTLNMPPSRCRVTQGVTFGTHL